MMAQTSVGFPKFPTKFILSTEMLNKDDIFYII